MTVPLRIGGGSRLKILESLACEVPVVSSTVGAEGLALEKDVDFFAADGVEEMAQRLVMCIRDPQAAQQSANAAAAWSSNNMAGTAWRKNWSALAVRGRNPRRLVGERMKTVLHLTSSRFYGGPERQMLGLAEHLPAWRTVFASFREGGTCQEFLRAAAQRGFATRAPSHDTPKLLAARDELRQLLRGSRSTSCCATDTRPI